MTMNLDDDKSSNIEYANLIVNGLSILLTATFSIAYIKYKAAKKEKMSAVLTHSITHHDGTKSETTLKINKESEYLEQYTSMIAQLSGNSKDQKNDTSNSSPLISAAQKAIGIPDSSTFSDLQHHSITVAGDNVFPTVEEIV